MRGAEPSGVIGSARAYQREAVADIQAERAGEAGPDRDAAGIVEVEQSAAVVDGAGNGLHAEEVGAADAAHEHARAAVALPGGQRLALDDRYGGAHAGHGGDARGDRVVVGEVALHRLHDDMAVDAEDLVEQLGPESVHHRHDDDKRRHAEHDAEEGEAGDHRDEGFLPARAEVAEREHPLEGRERARRLPRNSIVLGHPAQPVSATACTRRLIAASIVSDSRAPVARRFNSTSPVAAPRGPTMSCQGSPIRSMLANLAPAR